MSLLSISLKDVFFDSSLGFISKDKLKQGYSINNKELDEFYKNNENIQRNKKIKVKNNYKITGNPHDYQVSKYI